MRKSILKMLTSTSTILAFFNEYYIRNILPDKFQKYPFGKITVLLIILSLVSLYFLLRRPKHIGTMLSLEFYRYIFYYKTEYTINKINEKSNNYELYQYDDFSKLKIALELDAKTYPEEVSWSIYRWQDFYKKNNKLAYGLYHKNDHDKLHPVGGISVFPITQQTFDSLCNGTLQEIDITQDNLFDLQNEHNCRHWLIPGIVIFDSYKSLRVAILLHLFVKQFVSRINFPVQLIAWGFSPAGILVLKKFHFREVNKDGYYIRTFSSKDEFMNPKK